MIKKLITMTAVLLVSCSALIAQIDDSDAVRDQKSILETFRALVRFEGQKNKSNTIHVSKIIQDGDRKVAYACWEEDNSITILHLPLTLPLKKYSGQYYWLRSKARVDLKTGVVAKKEDIGGSSFLVDKDWVDDITRLCLAGSKLKL